MGDELMKEYDELGEMMNDLYASDQKWEEREHYFSELESIQEESNFVSMLRKQLNEELEPMGHTLEELEGDVKRLCRKGGKWLPRVKKYLFGLDPPIDVSKLRYTDYDIMMLLDLIFPQCKKYELKKRPVVESHD